MSGSSLRATVVGFVAALAVLGVLLVAVGINDVIAATVRADPVTLATLPVAAAVWLSAWGLSLRTVLGVLGASIPIRTAVLVYVAATFANNVTPFGQAGGEPISAYLIAGVTDNEYESGLAAIASVDALNFVPSVTLAGTGLVYFAVVSPLVRQLQVAALAVGAFVVGVPISGYLIWRYRTQIERAIATAITPLARGLTRVLPGREPPTRENVAARVMSFFDSLERVAADRRRLGIALSFATLGWVALSGSLWLSLLALGHRVPIAAVLVIVPIGSMASITPFPGGLGGIEAVLVALIVPTTGLDPATAGAAVVLHRLGTYWLPTVVGGAVAGSLGLDSLWN